ncbi:Secondary metabolism regulator LAE1 [Colletotrichum sp. SAR 10_65]|nr:Secondary metabolism regulator LAE1 [Colletotrichum sp. SAR 10_65]
MERAEGLITIDPALEEGTETQSEADTGSIFSSSTASLSESIYEYRRIQGRTYTQKVDYWGPNDDRQNEGLEINHWIMTLFLGDRLFLSPIGDNPQVNTLLRNDVLNESSDVADEFPSAEVFGVDVSPIQPKWVPTNCKFQIDDIEQLWTWPDNHFDFIHIRNLEGCISNWTDLYKQAFKHMAPGGYIEVKEHDIELRSQIQELDDEHIFNEFRKALKNFRTQPVFDLHVVYARKPETPIKTA